MKIGENFDVIINIQGDEPFIQRSQIKTVMDCFNDENTQIATLGKLFTTMEAVRILILQRLLSIITGMHCISHAQKFRLCAMLTKRNG